MKNDNKTEPEKPLSIEATLDRIEAIIAQMESGQLPLEEMIKNFEEGARLVKDCQTRLTEAEKKVQIVIRDAADQPSKIESFYDQDE